MGRVLTNATALNAAREASIATLPGTPDWFNVEFDSIGAFGAEVTTVARNPVSLDRGRKKGAVTDLDSSVEVDTDLTIEPISRFIESFFFAEYANLEFNLRASSGTVPPPATVSGYTIDAASTLLAGKMVYNVAGAISLVYAKGYLVAANNGVKPLTADVGGTDTTVQVAGLSAETPPTKASLQVCGVRVTDADLTLTVSGSTATLVSGADIADWATLGVFAGMYIHIGGVDTDGTVTNALNASASDDTYGYARVTSVSSATLNLDKLDANLAATADNSSEGVADVLIGRWVRDVPTSSDSDDTRYAEYSYHIEAVFPNLGAGGATAYEYAVGNYANELALNMPLTSKATMTMGFIGTTSEDITTSRKTGASSSVAPLRNTAFSSTVDLVSISTDLISSVSDVCFKNFTLTIGNEVSPEKCLGTLGATFMNAGQFLVDVEGQLAFTTADIINAIKNNTTVTMAFIVRNDDGAIACDIPEMTMGGGGREFPRGQTVLVNITGNSFTSDTYGHNAAMTIFPVVPQAA